LATHVRLLDSYRSTCDILLGYNWARTWDLRAVAKQRKHGTLKFATEATSQRLDETIEVERSLQQCLECPRDAQAAPAPQSAMAITNPTIGLIDMLISYRRQSITQKFLELLHLELAFTDRRKSRKDGRAKSQAA
jgi:hypothetical protein